MSGVCSGVAGVMRCWLEERSFLHSRNHQICSTLSSAFLSFSSYEKSTTFGSLFISGRLSPPFLSRAPRVYPTVSLHAVQQTTRLYAETSASNVQSEKGGTWGMPRCVVYRPKGRLEGRGACGEWCMRAGRVGTNAEAKPLSGKCRNTYADVAYNAEVKEKNV